MKVIQIPSHLPRELAAQESATAPSSVLRPPSETPPLAPRPDRAALLLQAVTGDGCGSPSMPPTTFGWLALLPAPSISAICSYHDNVPARGAEATGEGFGSDTCDSLAGYRSPIEQNGGVGTHPRPNSMLSGKPRWARAQSAHPPAFAAINGPPAAGVAACRSDP
jgi:hypothetical protein